MDAIELKFLLKLLEFPDYRASITEVKPTPNLNAAERDVICRQLADRGLVDLSIEVIKFKIAPPGKVLLKLDTGKLPITKQELKVLQASAEGVITPAESGITGENRQILIQGLVERGLIKAEKVQIKEVWLTEGGQQYLLHEYNPSGNAPMISLDLLGSYLRLMRKYWKSLEQINPVTSIPPIVPEEKIQVTITPTSKPNDEEILALIQDLDRQTGSDNYLPIFQLREKLTFMSREELDQILYRLQRNDQIELSSLQEAIAYTPEQIESGIPQNVGGPLFFIIVT